jgi:hypothetical protein
MSLLTHQTIFTDILIRGVTLCLVVLCSNLVRPAYFFISSRLLRIFLLIVSIVIYTALAAEFFLRYLTRRPIPGRVASTTPSAPAGAAELGEPSPNSSVVQVREKELEHEHSMVLKRVKIIGVALAFSTIVILIR